MRVVQGHGVDAFRSHWYPREGWARGPILTWHVLWSRAPALSGLAGRVHELLGDLPALGPVPIAGLHLTLTGVGPAVDVSPETLARVRERVAAGVSDLPRGEARFDELVVGHEGVMLTGGGLGWLTDLGAAVADATDTAWPAGPWSGSRPPVRPHVTLAYTRADGDPSDAMTALASLDGAPDVVAEHADLSLIELRLEDQRYDWDVVAEVGDLTL